MSTARLSALVSLRSSVRSFATTSRHSTIHPSTSESSIRTVFSTNARPLLVDFHATWCQPCKLLSPILTKLTEKQDSPVDLIRVDVDEQQKLAAEFGVKAMPTVLLVKEGKVVDGFVGMLPESKILQFLEKHQA